MAGGKGLRLRPLTINIPKPMIKINGKPLLEKLIIDAKEQGFINFILSINYLGNKIKEYFKNGINLGVSIQYIQEKKPLGKWRTHDTPPQSATSGPVGLPPNPMQRRPL